MENKTRYDWHKLLGDLKVDELTDNNYIYLSGKKKIKLNFYISDLDFFLSKNHLVAINFGMTGSPIHFSDLNYEQKRSFIEYIKNELEKLKVKIVTIDDKLRMAGVIE